MKKIIIFSIMLLFLFSLVSAQTAEEDYCLIQITLFNDGSSLVIGSSTSDPMIEEISYENETLYGLTQLLTNKQQEKWTFNLDLEKEFKEIYIKVILPENAKLGEITSNLVSFVTTENDLIVIEFADTNKIANIEFNYEIDSIINGEQVNYGIYFLIISIIATIVIIFLWFFLIKRKKKKKKGEEKEKPPKKQKTKKKNILREKLKTVRQTLNERENKIIEELIEHKKLKQSQLQHLTKIPKVSLSRHLVSLENKKLIIKKSLGKTNIIEINKDFDKIKK